MKLNYGTLAAAALFVLTTSPLASAQVSTVVTHSADPNTRTVSTTATATGPNGKQATRSWSTTANGNGSVTRSRAAIGPNGRTASGSATYTNNGNGTVTRVASQTGPAGRTRFATATAGNGVLTSSVTRRNGVVVNRTRVR